MFQEITAIGNVGQPPEMRYTPAGKAVTNFSVAVNEKYGETERTTWFKVTCWEKLAEVVNQYLTKGQLVFVKGRVQGGAYMSKQTNEPAVSLEIVANTVKFLSRKEEGTGAGPVAPSGAGAVREEDIPF
jgi:single-strand DNA-binding protein